MESKEEKSPQSQPPPGPPKELLPGVQGHIDALYSELLRGDAAPTAAQANATARATDELGSLLDGWRKLQAELPDLNRQLRAAGLPPVRADLAPPRDVNAADED